MSKNNSSKVDLNKQSVEKKDINEATEVQNKMTERDKLLLKEEQMAQLEELAKRFGVSSESEDEKEGSADMYEVEEEQYEILDYDEIDDEDNDRQSITDQSKDIELGSSMKANMEVVSIIGIDDEDNYPQSIIDQSKDKKIEGFASIGGRKQEQDALLLAKIAVTNAEQSQESINDMLTDYVHKCVEQNENSNGGATLSVGYLSAKNQTLYIRNLGDSRIVLYIEYVDTNGNLNPRSILVTEDNDIYNKRIMGMLDAEEKKETKDDNAKRHVEDSYLYADETTDEGVQTTSSIGDSACRTNKDPDKIEINLKFLVEEVFGENATLNNCKKIQVFACCDGITEGEGKDKISDKEMISYDYRVKLEKVENENLLKVNISPDIESLYHVIGVKFGVPQLKLRFEIESAAKIKSLEKTIKKNNRKIEGLKKDIEESNNLIKDLEEEVIKESNNQIKAALKEGIDQYKENYKKYKGELEKVNKLNKNNFAIIDSLTKAINKITSEEVQNLKKAINQYYHDRNVDDLLSEIMKFFNQKKEEYVGNVIASSQEMIKNSVFSNLIESIIHQEKLKHCIVEAIKVVNGARKEDNNSVTKFIKTKDFDELLNSVGQNPELLPDIKNNIKNVIFSKLSEHISSEDLIKSFPSVTEKKITFDNNEGKALFMKRVKEIITGYFNEDVEKRSIEKVVEEFCQELKINDSEVQKSIEDIIFFWFIAAFNSNKIDIPINIPLFMVNYASRMESGDNLACGVLTFDGSSLEESAQQKESLDAALVISDGHGTGGEKVSQLCVKIMKDIVDEQNRKFKEDYKINNLEDALENKHDLIQKLNIKDDDLDFYINHISRNLSENKNLYLESDNIETIKKGIYLMGQIRLLEFKKLCNGEKNINFDRSKNDIDMVTKRLRQQGKLYEFSDDNDAVVRLRKPSYDTMQSINLIEKYSADLKILQNQLKKHPIVFRYEKNQVKDQTRINVTGAAKLNGGVTKGRN